jgi:hypothetical protein
VVVAAGVEMAWAKTAALAAGVEAVVPALAQELVAKATMVA